jgi:hypothetical protein
MASEKIWLRAGKGEDLAAGGEGNGGMSSRQKEVIDNPITFSMSTPSTEKRADN